MNETYPEIARRAKAEGAEIQWGDETGLRSDDVRGRSYAPIGKAPERRVASRREGLSVMSTVTNRGQVRWKVFEGAMNADILLDFLKRLIKESRTYRCARAPATGQPTIALASTRNKPPALQLNWSLGELDWP
ncbi:transposase [Burkholderia pseudomallei]|nr:transposase [Burkholderia pseudomallei]MBF3426919.1 transposase [Burkholderia pseudomallei]MBF3505558.1 transposase [Burkholderia pseudomallei]MBF3551649.1 transposase [Burkholderia pseudomallei]MBF4021814.1 transposase [Burkholderia pseudomallei]